MIQDSSKTKNVKIKVIPNARKTEIVGTMDDGTLKVRIHSAPEKGKANKEILEFFTKTFGGKWDITSGITSARKILTKID